METCQVFFKILFMLFFMSGSLRPLKFRLCDNDSTYVESWLVNLQVNK